MSAAIAAILKKIAIMIATDKRFWHGVLSVIVGLVFVLLLLFGSIFSMLSFEQKHNSDLIKYIFNPDIPIEFLLDTEPQYYEHISKAREHLAEIKTEAETVNGQLPQPEGEEATDKGIDILKVQVIYYVLFLENNTFFNLPPKSEFIACFYTQTGDTITILTDENQTYLNIETLIGQSITEDEKKKITEIYNFLKTKTAFIEFDGEYSPPVELQYFNSITSNYGYRSDPFTGKKSYHDGTDFAWGGCFGANIYAAASGTVTRASDVGDGYGKCVVIDHGNGILTYYAHCSSIAVSVGDTVVKGQYISKIGSTGRSTGPHLHFGLKINGSWQDAMSLYQ